jgi:large subunit ribosomal protein L31e
MARKKTTEAKEEAAPESKPTEPVKEVEESKPAKSKKASKPSKEPEPSKIVEPKGETPKEKVDTFNLETVPASSEGQPTEIEKAIEEEKPAFDEEIQEERIYYVPLVKKGAEKAPNWERTKKAMRVLREFATRHMKPEGEVYISQELNERIWERGIKHPPRRVRVRFTKSVDGIVRAYLA